jgi:8-amino-7-oxononanoate synthase
MADSESQTIYLHYGCACTGHALQTSIALISGDEGKQRRQHLRQLIRMFSNGLNLRDWNLLPSQTAIQPVVIGDNAAMLQAAENLRKQGYWVGAIRPPTVPAGTARLRVTLTAAHQVSDVHMLVQAMNRMNQMAYIAQCFAEVA